MTDKPKHTYPTAYPRNMTPALERAWDILDVISPGTIPDDVRAFLAGAIAGALERAAERGKP